MKKFPFTYFLFFAFFLTTGCKTKTDPQNHNIPQTKQDFKSKWETKPTLKNDFDYYIMALSWSPEYCNQNGRRDQTQCGMGRKLGFVLHGLWPQYERGYPQNCNTTPLPNDLIEEFEGLFPSNKLFQHEWRKHGTCTGLSAKAYLQQSKTFKQNLRIPRIYQAPPNAIKTSSKEIKSAFSQSNPHFTADSFAPMCNGKHLRELFVCYNLNGNPRSCSADVLRKAQRSCKNRPFTLRNVR